MAAASITVTGVLGSTILGYAMGPHSVSVTGVTGTTNTPLTGSTTNLGAGTVTFGDGSTLASTAITLAQVAGAPTALSGFTNNLGNYGSYLTSANTTTNASFTGSISGTVLTVSAISSGAISLGNNIAYNVVVGNNEIFTDINNGVAITAQLTGTALGVGTYTVSYPKKEGIVTGSIAGTTMTVTAVTSGTLYVGQVITGVGSFANVVISAYGTGTGGIGDYTLSYTGSGGAVFVGSAVTGATRLMTVTSVTSGTLAPGQTISGGNIRAGTTIASQSSGTTGGAGVYVLNSPNQTTATPAGTTLTATATVASTTLTGKWTVTSQSMQQVTLSGYYSGNEYGPRYLNWDAATSKWSIIATNCNCNCNC